MCISVSDCCGEFVSSLYLYVSSHSVQRRTVLNHNHFTTLNVPAADPAPRNSDNHQGTGRNNSVPEGVVCNKCKEPGHYSTQCPSQNVPQNNTTRKHVTCHRCGEQGHYSSTCTSSNLLSAEQRQNLISRLQQNRPQGGRGGSAPQIVALPAIAVNTLVQPVEEEEDVWGMADESIRVRDDSEGK